MWTVSAMQRLLVAPVSDPKSACRPIAAGMQTVRGASPQARSVPSSSFSAHLITSSSFSPPCVNLATITVLIAWL